MGINFRFTIFLSCSVFVQFFLFLFFANHISSPQWLMANRKRTEVYQKQKQKIKRNFCFSFFGYKFEKKVPKKRSFPVLFLFFPETESLFRISPPHFHYNFRFCRFCNKSKFSVRDISKQNIPGSLFQACTIPRDFPFLSCVSSSFLFRFPSVPYYSLPRPRHLSIRIKTSPCPYILNEILFSSYVKPKKNKEKAEKKINKYSSIPNI